MQVPQILETAPYAILTVAILFPAYFNLRLRRRFSKALAAIHSDLQQTKVEIEQLHRNFAEACGKIQDAEERAGLLVPPTPPKSGLNISRRTQVIRMLRRGDRPENIAASLHLPKGEVELLLKVHRLAVDGRLPARNPQ
jgi:hypothetical protein